IMYIQVPTTPPNSTSSISSSQAASAPSAQPPVLSLVDADNLNMRESLSLPENITGRSILDSSSDQLYTVSDSGVMVLPVGRLNQHHRLLAMQRDVVAAGNFCNRNVITQTLNIVDPGGGNTDFSISANQAGVSISPSSGVTPATVQVRVDPAAFQNTNGTV